MYLTVCIRILYKCTLYSTYILIFSAFGKVFFKLRLYIYSITQRHLPSSRCWIQTLGRLAQKSNIEATISLHAQISSKPPIS